MMPNRGRPYWRPCFGATLDYVDFLATVWNALFRSGRNLSLCGRLCRLVASACGQLALRSVTFAEAEVWKRADRKAQEILASIERETAGVLLALGILPASRGGELALAQFQRRAAEVALQLDLRSVLREVSSGQPVIGACATSPWNRSASLRDIASAISNTSFATCHWHWRAPWKTQPLRGSKGNFGSAAAVRRSFSTVSLTARKMQRT